MEEKNQRGDSDVTKEAWPERYNIAGFEDGGA